MRVLQALLNNSFKVKSQKMHLFTIIFVIFLSLINDSNSQIIITESSACKENSRIDHPNHYSLIKLNCNWQQFLVESSQRTISRAPLKNDNLKIYEITFFKDEKLSNDDSKILKAGLFKTFNIKRLIMSNIGLEKIEDAAFDGNGLSNYLEELDLTSNSLKILETDTIKSLKMLKILKLGNNSLQFEDSNFIFNKYLTDIDLSSNNLQYLPKKLFEGLESLKKIDLRNNHLRKISACHFYSQSTEKKTSLLKFYQINVDLSGNEIDCTCDLFYMDRKTNINLKVLCNKPGYYKNKNFQDLINENPDCDYAHIRNQCESVYQDHFYLVENNNAYRIATFILAVLLIIVNLALICSCCRLCSLNDKLDLLTRHYNKKQTKKHNDKKYEYLTNMQ